MKKWITVIAVALFFVGTIFVSINTSTDTQEESVFLASSAVLTLNQGETKFFPCKHQKSEPQWKYSPSYSTFRCGYPRAYDYVGPFGKGGSITSPTFKIGAHRGLIVSFKVALLDSWESEIFQIKADGKIVYSLKKDNPSGPSKSCGNSGSFDEYKEVTFGFNHSESNVTFTLTSTLNQPSSNEAWGICGFIVSTSAWLVTSTGDIIYTVPIEDKPSSFFPCWLPPRDTGWSYVPKYQLILCPGSNIHLGAYGKGGYLEAPTFEFGTHQGLIISFNVGQFGSWNRKSFQIKADGKIVYNLTRANDQESSFTCADDYSSWSGENKTITFGLNHTKSFMRLIITSNLDQAAGNAAWSMCNLIITSSQWPVTADGQNIATVQMTNKLTYFSCTNPASSALWIYSQGYNTVTCGNNTFLGPYGKGGKATSPKFTLGRHSKLTVSFKVAYFDSWDNETFKVTADDEVIYSKKWSDSKSTSDSCLNGWDDAYKDVSVTFKHKASSVIFTISSNLDSSPNDEAWGICDFTVTAA